MRLWMLFGGKVSLDRSLVEIGGRREGQWREKCPTPLQAQQQTGSWH